MAVYDRLVQDNIPHPSFQLSERHIYGSSRIGIDVTTYEFISTIYTESNEVQRELGHKHYEISNHLGNVLSVITDQKLPVVDATVVVSYTAVVVTATDYSPFGVGLYGRSWSGEYRYGFQGQEEDEELWSGSVSYKYRVEDARLGRFFSVDPLMKSFPWNSCYSFSENSVIAFFELEGLEKIHFSEINITIYISLMNSSQVKALADSKGYNWDNDWMDKSASNEVWTLNRGYDKAGRNTGTRISKFSSRAAFEKSGGKPYFTEMDRTISEWARAWDAELDEREGWVDGLAISASVTAIVLSAGTALAAETLWGAIASTGSIALSADELTASPGNEGQTLIADFFEYTLGEDGVALFNGAKFAISVKNGAKGLVNITATLADGSTIDAVYDVVNDITEIVDVSIESASLIQSRQNENE